MKKYYVNVVRRVWGICRIDAKNLREARKKFDKGDYDIIDNKSEEEYDMKENGTYDIIEDK